MKIKNLEELDIGMSNIEIEGEVTYANDPRNFKGDSKGRHYDFWSQYIAVEDETDSIGCNITIKNEEAALFEGDQVTIKGKLAEFEDKNGDMQRKLNGRIKRTREEKAREEKTEVTGSEKANSVKEEATAVKKVTSNNGNNGKGDKNLYIARECAIKAATELICAKKIKIEGLLPFSEKIVEYIFEGYQEEEVKAEDETPPDKEEKIASARHIVEEKKLEVREGHEDDKIDEEEKIIDDEEDEPGSSPQNAIPYKGKKKKLKKISKAEDFIIEENIPE
ncbi:hypothetical protein ES705_29228 [subsurface metagenome]